MDLVPVCLVLITLLEIHVKGSPYYASGDYNECGRSYRYGPHSMDCLIELWTSAGCYMTGTKSPRNADHTQLEWWNRKTVHAVSQDMDLYYEYAMNGDADYRQRCFGNTESCSYKDFPGYALYGLNDVTLSQATPQMCASKCDDMGDDCKSFDYNTQTKSCLLSSSNRETAPDAYGAHANLVYYERVCGEDVEDPWTSESSDTVPGVVVNKDGQCYVEYGPVGGAGGQSFDDREFSRHENITKIAIRYANLLDAIQITYGERLCDRHGGNGGQLFEATLDSGEYITGAKGRTGYYFDSLTIITNKRELGPFGKEGGDKSFQIDSGGKPLAYISGKSGSLIDQLTFYFNC